MDHLAGIEQRAHFKYTFNCSNAETDFIEWARHELVNFAGYKFY